MTFSLFGNTNNTSLPCLPRR